MKKNEKKLSPNTNKARKPLITPQNPLFSAKNAISRKKHVEGK